MRRVLRLGGRLLGQSSKKMMIPVGLSLTMPLYYKLVICRQLVRQDDSVQEVSKKIDSSQILEGQMIEVQIGEKEDDKVLVARVDGKLHCVSNQCTHYGAPLAKGLLVEDRVLCPWHAASFSVKTGAHEYGPVMDGLQVFNVEEKEGVAVITVDLKKLNVRRTIPMSKHTQSDHSNFLIIGTGPSAISCAETLRQSGYEGNITMFGDETYVPYDRTLLTKMINGTDINSVQLRSQDFLNQYDIKVEKGVKVSMVDYDNNQLYTQDGRKFKYDKLLVATGGSAIMPNITGNKLQNVFTWRSLEDLKKIQKSHEESALKKVVIVGGGFIGMEAASSMTKDLKCESITVVDLQSAPLERVLGVQVGNSLKELAESKGVKFRMNDSVKEVKGENGKVKSVVMQDGTEVEADAVIVGVGIKPNNQLFPSKCLDQKNGGVLTDAFMQTCYKNVFAAGDVASVPYVQTGDQIRVEHYNDAIQQGQIAAFNMLNKLVPLDLLPFFYTRQHDKSLAYTGYAQNFDKVQIQGDLSQQKFIALYSLNDRILAAAGMQRNADILIVQEALKQNLMPKASDFEQQSITFESIKEKLQKTKCGRCKRMDHCQSKRPQTQ